jgi:putative SOS response-associated peptidase YedK
MSFAGPTQSRRLASRYTNGTMCGRYRLSSTERFLERFQVENEIELAPRYNIAPCQFVPIVRQHRERPVRTASMVRWGLIPYWSKDDKGAYKMINARAETVAERPAFREPIQRHRCLVPANGFYEWERRGAGKQPYHFGMADDSLFAFAGIWDRWKSPAGDLVESCSILTTTANALLADIHDRMPVILREEDYDLWLDPGYQRGDAIVEMLRPFDAAAMRRYPVSTRVNSVSNEDAQCAAEANPQSATAATLFPM